MNQRRAQGIVRFAIVGMWLAVTVGTAAADVRLPALFTDHLVLQRKQANPVWGWADPGEEVTVTLAGQSHQTKADADGRWRVALDPLPAGGPHVLEVQGGNVLTVRDVLVGEVWLCSGQSNMQWSVAQANDPDLEIATAKYPRIRLITVPRIGTQEPQDDFEGAWQVCSPKTVADFSAVGYFFGRQLHETLDVPIGLIDNAWGGSACEAWIRRDLLEADRQHYGPLLDRWADLEQNYDHDAAMARFEQRLKQWQSEGREGNRPRPPRNPLTGQHRPANLYNGVLHPLIGYGIRGAIWYQGEANAGRAYQYRHLFPFMIQHWRDEWQQNDFPFYWVQLADFRREKPEPAESDWAELREAQTMTLDRLDHTGQAVTIDLGEADDIHPKNKQDVGKRLARWALARDYGIDLTFQSPRYRAMERNGGKIILRFDIGEHPGGVLDTFDTREPVGFAIAGEDRQFVWAEAKIIGRDLVEVWSEDVSEPVAVRYAWADNPVCNLQNRAGLPAVPFRTDDWPGVTAEAR